MKKTTKPFEVVYITFFSHQIANGDFMFSLIALDDFTENILHIHSFKETTDLNELIGNLVKFVNGVQEKYEPNIHANSTTYYSNLPPDLQHLLKSMIRTHSTLVDDPKRVKEKFKPVFEHMDKFMNRKN